MPDTGKEPLKVTYIIYPHWGGLFFLIGGAIVILVGVLAWFLLGVSAISDRVFAIEALISGLGAEQIFRAFLHRRLVVAPKMEIPFIYVWPLLCLYVFVVQPFTEQ